MFEAIHALRKRSNSFVKDINSHKAKVIEDDKKYLIEVNQSQFQKSKLADGKPIRPFYSKPYAKKKGYKNPDLYVTGNMYDKMDVKVYEKTGTFGIFSTASYTKYLKRYGKLFGISPKNFPKTSKRYIKSFQKLWYTLVLK